MFQAYASHFLEDCWATGHMFERWGLPEFQDTDAGKLQNSIAAMVTGMIHGARAVSGFHDQANMPGPNPFAPLLDDPDVVRFHDGRELQFLRQIFGTEPNLGARDSRSALEDVRNDRIGHFERRDPSTWTLAPPETVDCTSDTQCAELPGTYCDRSVVEGDAVVRRCVPQETALLRAFRAAETPTWCREQTWDSLNAARRECQSSWDATSVECTACTRLLLPRLRNACDPSGPELEPGPGDFDGRAICDFYDEAGLVSVLREDEMVHVPFEPEGGETDQEAIARVALEQCFAGPQERPSRVGSTYESTPDEAAPYTLSAQTTGFTHDEITCGREGGVHWDRVTHPAGSPSGTVEITLTPTELVGYPYAASANDFELAVFQGPACTDPIVVIPGEQEPDGVPWLQTTWVVDTAVPDEICIRVRPLRPIVRSGHSLHVSRR